MLITTLLAFSVGVYTQVVYSFDSRTPTATVTSELTNADAEQTQPARKKTIFFNCPVPSRSPLFIAYAELYRQAFKPLGYNFEMIVSPSKRGINDLSQGLVDGNCGRGVPAARELESRGLLRIDVPVARSTLIAWTYQAQWRALNLERLRSDRLNVGSVRGSGISEPFVRHQPAAHQLTSVSMGLKMLQAGRLDVFISESILVATTLLLEPSLDQPHPSLALAHSDLYPFLSKQYPALRIPLTEQLQWQIDDPTHFIHQFSGLTSPASAPPPILTTPQP